MDGEMPAERFRVKDGTGNIECHPYLTMQPAVDQSNCFFLSGGNKLRERRELIMYDNFRHSYLLWYEA
jgi:hypothetical protein